MDKFILTNKLYDISNYYSLYLYANIKLIINNKKKFKFHDTKLIFECDIEEWIDENQVILKKYDIIFEEISNNDPAIDGLYTDLKNINMILILSNNDMYIYYITNKLFDIFSNNFLNNKYQYIEIFETKNKYNVEITKLDEYVKALAYEQINR
ncbi:unknown similar to AMEV206 [Choristoneura rosaceana entomopoxvirus 'L']|uniref:N1R/p28-like protein n=1 Tax=Choristoneura rosaceana entomopoxvirus 'L' TaxID=1293539 RepID=A0ABM9QKR1_9POXV|nr:unknown similar to AMEV206 [Choristoneura rosaceana entomopoxvirus 'L']CCU56106.1 unknown similar to AMEV206 [Choristoneura rosaceana entomopoxvirus 'L']